MWSVCVLSAVLLLLLHAVAGVFGLQQDAPLRCRLGMTPCKDNSDCVLFVHVCDGEKDCADGSDEAECATVCSKGQFQCAHGKMCIDQSQVCDGVVQCQDRSDEMGCIELEEGCGHRCGKLCLPEGFVCDGHMDCEDGSDEDDCDDKSHEAGELEDVLESATTDPYAVRTPLRCLFGSWPCRDRSQCIQYLHVCDGEQDCRDGSDELECTQSCERGEGLLGHVQIWSHVSSSVHMARCVLSKVRCVMDGRNVRTAAMSPAVVSAWKTAYFSFIRSKLSALVLKFQCSWFKPRCCLSPVEERACSSTEFQCTSGQCVSVSRRCDGRPDCRDHSDEDSCTNWTECREANCAASPVQCGQFQWQCASTTQCVPQSWRCDGTNDCTDESDEATCEPVSCPPHLFQCGSSECLDPSLLCNGITDCLNGSDEGGACSTDTCTDQSQCAHDCYSTPTGTRCWCRAGYKPKADAVECVDVDECVETPAVCAHSCVNSVGSFQCSCNQGYVLEPDGRNCTAPGESYLLASAQSELLLLDLQTSSLDVLLSSEALPVLGLDYDWQERRVYWVDPEAVKWITLDKKTRGTLVGDVRAGSVAVDWVGRRLYWTDGVDGQINAVALEGSEPVVIVEKDVEEPGSLTLLPQKGLMFWSETGDEAQIERAGMDGSDRRVLVQDSVLWPTSLAVDALKEHLYWTDEKLRCIGSATLDGEDAKFLQLMETPSPFSLSVFGDMVYWSDVQKGTVQRTHKSTGKRPQVLLERPGQRLRLKGSTRFHRVYTDSPGTGLAFHGTVEGCYHVVHSLLQPSVENPCVSSRCSHLCVLAPGLKGVCKCPSELVLDKDELTCSKPNDSTFLLLLSPTALTQVTLQSRKAGVGLQNWPEHRKIELPHVTDLKALDLAIQGRALYVWDAGLPAVSLFRLKDTEASPGGTLFSLLEDTLNAMAVDWVTLNLYWSSRGQTGLRVTTAKGTQTALLLRDEVRNVSSITLQPVGGRMCFTNSVEPRRVQLECSYMDGRNRTVVWVDGVQPVSLSLSKAENRLYWADTSLGVIASIGADGFGYQELRSEEGLVAFALADEVLVWVTGRGSTKCWFSEDQERATVWFEVEAEVVDVKAFSRPGQKGDDPHLAGISVVRKLQLPTRLDLHRPIHGYLRDSWVGSSGFPGGVGSGIMDWDLMDSSMVQAADSRVGSNGFFDGAGSGFTGSNSCSISNGGCAQLCLAFPGGRTCRCGRGFLSFNETGCAADPHCPSGTRPCLSGDECVPQERFCDGQPDCPDHSDEICVQEEAKHADGPKANVSGAAAPPAGPRSFGSVLVKKPGSEVSGGSGLPSAAPESRDDEVKSPSPETRPTEPGLDRGVKVDSVDAESCGARLCSGNGQCVSQGGKTVCQCASGYSRMHCEEPLGGIVQGPVIYAAGGLCVAVIVLGVTVGVIQKRKAANRRYQILNPSFKGPWQAATPETRLQDLENAEESTPAQANGKDPEHAEGEASAAD
ncbi:hypothetical protein NFI96_023497 [Prochilodus magdalenae]|nr:hypothetical protein NFI96_023497 [Prochilodus magdalenae]